MSKYAWHMQKNSRYLFCFNNSQDVFWSSKKFLWWEFLRQESFSNSARMLTICQTSVPQVATFPSFHLLCYRKTKCSLQLIMRFLPNFNIFLAHHVSRADLCFTLENFHDVITLFCLFRDRWQAWIQTHQHLQDIAYPQSNRIGPSLPKTSCAQRLLESST